MQVYVDEGGPAMFECRVEPKHDLNLSGIESWQRKQNGEILDFSEISALHTFFMS